MMFWFNLFILAFIVGGGVGAWSSLFKAVFVPPKDYKPKDYPKKP